MNAEIKKAIAEKQKKHPIRKWWNKNGYKVMRVVLSLFGVAFVQRTKLKTISIPSANGAKKEQTKFFLTTFLARQNGTKMKNASTSQTTEWVGE